MRVLKGVPEEVRRLTRQVAAIADRDVTQSDALLAVIRYGLDHLPEVAALLPPENGQDDDTQDTGKPGPEQDA